VRPLYDPALGGDADVDGVQPALAAQDLEREAIDGRTGV